MSLTAFLLILLSAFLHAAWNFLCKSHHPTPSFMLVLNIMTGILGLPLFCFSDISWGSLPLAFWIALGFSILANAVYCIFLAQAYRYGDISVSYPLSRSIPVLLTALVTTVFHLGKVPSVCAFIGLVILFFGCVCLPQPSFRSLAWRNFKTPAMIPILLAAVGTTTYTISDSIATAHFSAHSASSRIVTCVSYYFILQLGISVVQWFILYFLCSRENRVEMRRAFRQRSAYLAAVFNFAAYSLVLLAMGYVTNVSFVQAFRQMGLPLGVFAGIYFLHEKLSFMKVLGVIMIVAGLVLTVI